MRHVAFFRNLNLGRAHCPGRVQFEEAFLRAGAGFAQSFLTNGTIAFDAPRGRPAQRLVDAAASALAAECGLREPAFVRELPFLAALAEGRPFADIDPATVYECCVTFLHDDAQVPDTLPLVSPRGDVQVVHVGGGEVMTVVHKFGASPGSPNAWLEKALGLPATTRAWNTVLRLVAKHGAAGPASSPAGRML